MNSKSIPTIDFKQAYYSIKRNAHYSAMNLLGIPTRLILLCQMTLKETQSVVRISKKASDTFTTSKGFRQGDALSCDLFNICLEIIMRKTERATSSSIITKSVQILRYADDIDIISRNVADLTTSFINIRDAASSIGLEVNVEKTKYI